MNTQPFHLRGLPLTALPSGALWDKTHRCLTVSDLHLGKSDRHARRSGVMLPPYENRATLDKLSEDVAATDPKVVICLGDSFDDLAASDALDDGCRTTLLQLQAGRQWVWIEGNHDPGPVDLGGTHKAEVTLGPLTYRHIATDAPVGEVSGHYHPKMALPGAGRARACFAFDTRRLILPAYGAYTGGLDIRTPVLRNLFDEEAKVILTGRKALLTRMPKR